MTGFDVSLRQKTDDPKRAIPLAGWNAAHLGWIDDLVEQAQAELVVDQGGYHCLYALNARQILAWFALDSRDELARRLNCKVARGEWNTSLGAGSLQEADLANCPSDAILQVEAWDQS